tara:strand:+ start:89 stop:328 length:240 start_codon:yes stop_codon:yes gene_type:complete
MVAKGWIVHEYANRSTTYIGRVVDIYSKKRNVITSVSLDQNITLGKYGKTPMILCKNMTKNTWYIIGQKHRTFKLISNI